MEFIKARRAWSTTVFIRNTNRSSETLHSGGHIPLVDEARLPFDEIAAPIGVVGHAKQGLRASFEDQVPPLDVHQNLFGVISASRNSGVAVITPFRRKVVFTVKYAYLPQC
jgi:hypothetical protein